MAFVILLCEALVSLSKTLPTKPSLPEDGREKGWWSHLLLASDFIDLKCFGLGFFEAVLIRWRGSKVSFTQLKSPPSPALVQWRLASGQGLVKSSMTRNQCSKREQGSK